METVLLYDKSSTSNFYNWIKAHLTVFNTKKEIEPVVVEEMKQFQQKCLQDIIKTNSLPLGSTCSDCSTENLVVCPTSSLCNVKGGKCDYHRNNETKYLPSGCHNNICNDLISEIQKAHRYLKPSFRNTDAKQWCSNPWEIAKCYMPPDGYKTVACADDCDFNALINVIINFKGMQSQSQDDLANMDDCFTEGRQICNQLRHSPNLNVTDDDLSHCVDVFNNILCHPRIKRSSKDSCIKTSQLDVLISEKGIFLELCNSLKEEFNQISVTEENKKISEKDLNEKIDTSTKKIDEIKTKAKNLHKELYDGFISLVDSFQELYLSKHTQGEEINKSKESSNDYFVTKATMPTLNPKDGTLIALEDSQLRGLLENCKPSIIQGGFGTVKITKNKVPGLDIHVAIKEIQCRRADDKHRSAANEMIATRVLHFAISPLIAYFDMEQHDEQRSFYLLFPYFENGNLLDCIARDKDAQKENIMLEKEQRKKILYHIASALEYLHTEVTGFRGKVLHADISSNNVVLDSHLNARLTDFGVACQLNENQSGKNVTREFGKTGYRFTKMDSKLRVYDDNHNFGVIIREMLTGMTPTETSLRTEDSMDIRHAFQSTIWQHDDEDAQKLLTLSERCIESARKNKHDVESSHIVEELANLLLATAARYTDVDTREKCILCLVNNAVTGLNKITHNCNQDINVCVSCMRNSHINPIRCPYCSKDTVYPKIGHTFAALLIAGNATKTEDDKSLAKLCKSEVDDIHDVLVSKWPCVIGIREENVKVVKPSDPGTKEDLLPKFKKAVQELQKKNELETLIIYFTGHNVDEGFILGHENEYLSLDDFLKDLESICHSWKTQVRFLVFLDCCGPKPIKIKLDTKVLQINVCAPDQYCSCPSSGSLFKTFFIQALTRKSFNKKCFNMPSGRNECTICSISGDFVSAYSLQKYIAEHMEEYTLDGEWNKQKYKEQKPIKFENNLSTEDAIIAYNVDFAIDPIVWYENEKAEEIQITFSPDIYPDIDTLKKQIFKNILEKVQADEKHNIECIQNQMPDVLCMQMHNDASDEGELQSMLDLSTVMIGKREIKFSYRKVKQIRNGRAVLFQSQKLVCMLVNEWRGESLNEVNGVVVFETIRQADDFISHLTKKSGKETDVDTKRGIENVKNCFQDIAKIWRPDQRSLQLKVEFPRDLDHLCVFELA